MLSEVRTKLGEAIRAERERQKISLEEIGERLKMSIANLEAIERGDTSTLPSEVYFELFAKGYAEALGVDYARTIEAIEYSLQELPPAVPTGKTPKEAPAAEGADQVEAEVEIDETEAADNLLIKKGLWIFGIIVAVFAAFMVVNWIWCSNGEEAGGFAEETPTEAISLDEGAAEATDRTSDEAFANYDWNVPKYEKPEKLRLRLSAREQSWSTVVADGDTVIFRNLMPGRVYEAEANYRLRISVGIPRVVDVELNGQSVDLRNPETRRISRVFVDQTNIDSILNPPPPPEVEPEQPANEEAGSESNEFENQSSTQDPNTTTDPSESDEP